MTLGDMIRQRTASLVVSAAVGLAVGFVSDGGWLGGVFAAAVAFALLYLLTSSRRQESKHGPAGPAAPDSSRGPFQWTYRWQLRQAPDVGVLADRIAEYAKLHSVSVSRDEAVLRGGSR